MPTGYTHGIETGKIKTFRQFALVCTRAFIMHMRDDAHDAPYYARTVGTYHTDAIQVARDGIAKLKKTSDKELIDTEREALRNQHLDNIRKVAEMLELKKTLNGFIEKASAFVPPKGGKHQGIKKFMIEQLENTIKWDCDPKYYEEEIADDEIAERNIDPVELRKAQLKEFTENIAYHKKEHKKEEDLCVDHNKWYDDFVAALGDEVIEENEEIL